MKNQNDFKTEKTLLIETLKVGALILAVLTGLCLFAAHTSNAATVAGNIYNSFNVGQTNAPVVFYPQNRLRTLSGKLVTSAPVSTVTDTNGNFSVTLLAGDYKVVANGRDSFRIAVPNDEDSHTVEELTTENFTYLYPTVPTAASVALATSSAAGSVVTDITEGSPTVYTKTTMDFHLDNKPGTVDAQADVDVSGGSTNQVLVKVDVAGTAVYRPFSTDLDARYMGATGDGVTDDAAKINAAIATAATSGQTLIFRAGTYRLLSGIVISNSNVNVVCQPGAIFLRDFDHSTIGQSKYVTGEPTVGVELIAVGDDRNGDSSIANNYTNIFWTGGEFRSNTDMGGAHMVLRGVKNLKVKDVKITSWNNDWATMFSGNGVHLSGFEISGYGERSGNGSQEDGLHLYAGTDALIENCIIDAGDDALAIGNSHGLSSSNVVARSIIAKANIAHMVALGKGESASASGIQASYQKVYVDGVTGKGGKGLIRIQNEYLDVNNYDPDHYREVHVSNVRGWMPDYHPSGVAWTGGYLAHIDRATKTTLQNCVLEDPFREGLLVEDSTDITISDILILGKGEDQSGDGLGDYRNNETIHLSGVTNLVISRVTGEHYGGTQRAFRITDNSTNVKVRDVTIKDGSGSVEFMEIFGNQIDVQGVRMIPLSGQSTPGMRVGTSDGVTIAGCDFSQLEGTTFSTFGTPVDLDIGVNKGIVGSIDMARDLVIATGALSLPPGGNIRVGAESGTTDTMISMVASGSDGAIVWLTATNSHTITLNHTTGANGLNLRDDSDFVMAEGDFIAFREFDGEWFEFARIQDTGKTETSIWWFSSVEKPVDDSLTYAGSEMIGRVSGYSFSPSATEYVIGWHTLPDHWHDRVEVTLIVANISGDSSADARMSYALESLSDADAINVTGSTATQTFTVPGTQWELEEWTFTNRFDVPSDPYTSFRVYRTGADGADTFAGDLFVMGVKFTHIQ